MDILLEVDNRLARTIKKQEENCLTRYGSPDGIWRLDHICCHSWSILIIFPLLIIMVWDMLNSILFLNSRWYIQEKYWQENFLLESAFNMVWFMFMLKPNQFDYMETRYVLLFLPWFYFCCCSQRILPFPWDPSIEKSNNEPNILFFLPWLCFYCCSQRIFPFHETLTYRRATMSPMTLKTHISYCRYNAKH